MVQWPLISLLATDTATWPQSKLSIVSNVGACDSNWIYRHMWDIQQQITPSENEWKGFRLKKKVEQIESTLFLGPLPPKKMDLKTTNKSHKK